MRATTLICCLLVASCFAGCNNSMQCTAGQKQVPASSSDSSAAAVDVTATSADAAAADGQSKFVVGQDPVPPECQAPN